MHLKIWTTATRYSQLLECCFDRTCKETLALLVFPIEFPLRYYYPRVIKGFQKI